MGNGRGRTVSLGEVSKVIAPGYYEPEYGFGGAAFPWYSKYNNNYIEDTNFLDDVNRPLDDTDMQFVGTTPEQDRIIMKYLRDQGIEYTPNAGLEFDYVSKVVEAVERVARSYDDDSMIEVRRAFRRGLRPFYELARDDTMTLAEKIQYHYDNWFNSNDSDNPWYILSSMETQNFFQDERREHTKKVLAENKIARDRFNEGVYAIKTVEDALPNPLKNTLKEISIRKGEEHTLAWVYNIHNVMAFNETTLTDKDSDRFYNFYETDKNPHNVGITWTDTALHEYGHHLFMHVIGMRKPTRDYDDLLKYAKRHPTSQLNKIRKAYAEFLDDVLDYGEYCKYEAVSRYGNSSIDEAIAESFLLYVRGMKPVMGEEFQSKFELMMTKAGLSNLYGLIPNATPRQIAIQEQGEEIKFRKFLNKNYKSFEEIEADFEKGLFNEATYDYLKDAKAPEIVDNKEYTNYYDAFLTMKLSPAKYKEKAQEFTGNLQKTLDKYKKDIYKDGKIDTDLLYGLYDKYDIDDMSTEGELIYELARYTEKDEWWQYTDPVEIDIASKLGLHDKERTVKLKYEWFRNAHIIAKSVVAGDTDNLNHYQKSILKEYFQPAGYLRDTDMMEEFVFKARDILKKMADKYEDILF